ncbi:MULTISPECIES: class I SAM-dependent methyltransferase [Rhodomicrobium]|uniref:class I SAM-dependent methyltransferase n=1 Tax=Rhodomicrobium TaxID=1068 RepID=UPI000B4A613C|nr:MULTISPECIES: class I SAM-dependent methyltransferase [Rhodomicrobium]
MILDPSWINALFAPTEIAVASPRAGLIPVIRLVVGLCRPERFVALGTGGGCGFLAALSAAKASGLTMQATAIDDWPGDEGDAAMHAVEAGIAAIGAPATIIRKNVDDAIAEIGDARIDLLLLSGSRGHEAAMRAFRGWQPLLSPPGVVLLQDIAIGEDASGARPCWEALSAEFPHLSFDHSGGLGVLFPGSEIPVGIQPLLERWTADPECADALRLTARIAGHAFGAASGVWDGEPESALLRLARAAAQPPAPPIDTAPLTAEIASLRAALAAQDAAHIDALMIQQERFAAERGAQLARLRSLRKNLAELQETGGRIRSSRLWPLLRFVRPLRKRLKHLAQVTERTRQLAHADAPPLRTRPNRSRSDLMEALPQIAQSFREHGMRPGHWVAPEVTRNFQKHGFTIVANTFYAVTPDLNELDDSDWRADKYAAAWKTVPTRPIDEMLGRIAGFSRELSGIPLERPGQEGRFYWNNPMFSALDAAAYYGIVRGLEPQRILEVGSGYSTAVALMAAERCARRIEISCIEPFPSPFLRSQRPRLHTLIERKIQHVDPLLFETLEPGDVLFIDSSHCSHLGSDLNLLMFECLPRLKPGIYVHFHDIFLPSEYPRIWLEDIGIMWNEQYLLLAFLMSNKNFEVVWSSSNAALQRPEALREMFAPLLPEDAAFLRNIDAYSGGSLWLRKTG